MLEDITWIKPEEIEARSMAIIEQEMPQGDWTEGELAVVKRCIHTSADFDYAHTLYFSENVIETAVTLLKTGGVTIVTDTNMAAAGVNRAALSRCRSQVRCFMADPDVAAEAKARGVTRAIVSIERAAALPAPVILAIGNAPTALIRACELIRQGTFHPSMVIGAPVGFVNVVEAKNLLITTPIPCITPRGRKGGSPIAAAILNALLYQATPAHNPGLPSLSISSRP